MRKGNFINIYVLCILVMIVLCGGVASADKVPDKVISAINKVEAKEEGVEPLNAEALKEFKDELGRFFAWQTSGNLAERPEDVSVVEAYMPDLHTKISHDSEGKAAGEFISCGEKGMVKMKDSTQYLFYQDKWWKIPRSESAE